MIGIFRERALIPQGALPAIVIVPGDIWMDLAGSMFLIVGKGWRQKLPHSPQPEFFAPGTLIPIVFPTTEKDTIILPKEGSDRAFTEFNLRSMRFGDALANPVTKDKLWYILA